MHLPQKPCSCLSLWKSCGLREKVHTCVCLRACVLLNSFVSMCIFLENDSHWQKMKGCDIYIFSLLGLWSCLLVLLLFVKACFFFSFLLLFFCRSKQVSWNKHITFSWTDILCGFWPTQSDLVCRIRLCWCICTTPLEREHLTSSGTAVEIVFYRFWWDANPVSPILLWLIWFWIWISMDIHGHWLGYGQSTTKQMMSKEGDKMQQNPLVFFKNPWSFALCDYTPLWTLGLFFISNRLS